MRSRLINGELIFHLRFMRGGEIVSSLIWISLAGDVRNLAFTVVDGCSKARIARSLGSFRIVTTANKIFRSSQEIMEYLQIAMIINPNEDKLFVDLKKSG